MKSIFLTLFLFMTPFLVVQAKASGSAVFGPEWTFTSPKLIKMYRLGGPAGDVALVPYAESLINNWAQVIKKRCPECRAEWSMGSMRVQMSEGFWFSINLDQLVLEVNSTPGTIKTFRKYKDKLQSLVWDSALEIGLKPHYRFGGGHVHISREESFKRGWLIKSPNEFYMRNFIADILSSPEVFMGGLGFDLLNASDVSLYPREIQRKLEIIFTEFDDLVIDYKELEFRIKNEIFIHHAMMGVSSSSKDNQVLNLAHEDTFEVRGLRPQVDMEHFLLILELLQARINKAKTSTPKAMRLKGFSGLFETSTQNRMQTYTLDVHPERIEAAAVDYIERSGLDSERYRPYFTEELKGSLAHGSDMLSSSLAERAKSRGLLQCKRIL